MKKFIRNHWLIVLILASLLMMLVIHIIFKVPEICGFLKPKWSAGDVLSYCGAIIGAVATIYVLQETIHSTAQLQREEREFAIRPYFTFSAEAYTVAYRNNGIDISNLSPEEKWTGNIAIQIKMTNVGTGNALLEKICLSQEEVGNKPYSRDNLPVLIAGNEQVLYLKFCKPGILHLELFFSDIAELASYKAKAAFRIVSSNGKVYVSCERFIQETTG